MIVIYPNQCYNEMCYKGTAVANVNLDYSIMRVIRL